MVLCRRSRAPLLAESVVDVAGRSDWPSPLLTALAARRARAAWFEVAAGGGALGATLFTLFLTWWLFTHRLDRFMAPAVTSLAVLAGLGADWVRSVAWSILLGVLLTLAIVTNLAFTSTALAGLNEWTTDLRDLRARVPQMINLPLARLDAELPPEVESCLARRPGGGLPFSPPGRIQHSLQPGGVRDPDARPVARGGQRNPRQGGRDSRLRGLVRDRALSFAGHHGFTDYVTPELFSRLVAAGVLKAAEHDRALRQELYQVDGRSQAWTR